MEQGMTSHVVGNTFWHMAVVRGCFGGTTMGAKIINLNAYLRNWYKTTQCKRRIQGALTQERLRGQADWPKLKAKAAATKHVVAFCVHVMETFGDLADPFGEGNMILAVCKLLLRFYHIMDHASQFLTDGQKTELRKLSETFCGIYANLSAKSFAAGSRMWKIQPKLHLFQHLAEYMLAYQGNPRFYWTYQDEDLVGDMINVARGVHVDTLATSVLFKWIHYCFRSQ
jgi:hypothetical protein